MHPDRSSDDEKVIPLRRADSFEDDEAGGRRHGASRSFPTGRIGLLARGLLRDVKAEGILTAKLGQDTVVAREDEEVPEDFTLRELTLALSVARNTLVQAREADPGQRAGEPVKRLHDALDEAVMRRVKELLRRQTRAHNRLIQDVSHDIRSPLNSILFLADALRTEQGGPLNRVQARQADVLFMASVSLVKLVNDLIDQSRLDEDVPIRIVSVPFSMERVISELRHLVNPLLTYHGVRLMVDLKGEGNRRGDPQLLGRVLLNLVTNATQELPEGGSVRVRVDGTESQSLRLSVNDDGYGADLQAIRSALELASRGESPPGETRAWTHGLGLTISSRLICAAGGSIAVRAPAGGGTTFDLELPFPAI